MHLLPSLLQQFVHPVGEVVVDKGGAHVDSGVILAGHVQRVGPATKPVPPLQHHHRDAPGLQEPRCGQAGDTATDHDDRLLHLVVNSLLSWKCYSLVDEDLFLQISDKMWSLLLPL